MPEVAQLHRKAMEFADRAAAERRRGYLDNAQELTRKAFELERDAARTIENQFEFEPTRSVLHRSAASLALECDEIREAERLIGRALSGSPPNEIAEELRDLLEVVYFHRHLALRGVVLQPDEFQLSLEGEAVGLGIAQTNDFLSRVRDIEALIFRTAERKRGREFREAGRRPKELTDAMELYVSVPRAASFAISFRVGSAQLKLPGINFSREVITDVFDCFELLDAGELKELEERISDESYFRNFVGLAEQIAPDGERIRRVGLTTTTEDGERRVALSTKREKIRAAAIALKRTVQEQTIRILGTLLAADAKHMELGRIQIVDDNGKAHRVRVPRGMMSDIVKPMFEERVIATARRKEKVFLLESINLVEAGAE